MTSETSNWLKPGDEAVIRSKGPPVKATIKLSEGTEFEVTLSPGDEVRVKLGSSSCTVVLEDIGDTHEGVRIVRDKNP